MTVSKLKLIVALTTLLFAACSQSGKPKTKKHGEKDSVPELTRKVKHVGDKGSELSLQELYENNKNAVFLIYTSDGETYHQGSGFFVSQDGVGVSNYHVFAGTFKGKEVIKVLNGAEYQIAEVIDSDKELDYIVFRVANTRGEIFSCVPTANKPVSIGQSVFAIGNPKGLESTLSTGIVSSIRVDEHLIQTTAEITNGSSGGPLFNMNGQVIGITSSGMGEANLNFAVDIRVLGLK